MISFFTRKIFPDFCTVTKCPNVNAWIYPIFKNGSSTIRRLQTQQNWNLKINEQISALDCVTVIIRDPISRFVSGYNTCLDHTMRDHAVDIDTSKKMVEQDPFSDRHITPQYNWLAHLAFYMKPHAKIKFEDMAYLQNISNDITNPQKIFHTTLNELDNKYNFQDNPFIIIDQILHACVGQTITFEDINKEIKISNPEVYDFLFGPILKFAYTHALS